MNNNDCNSQELDEWRKIDYRCKKKEKNRPMNKKIKKVQTSLFNQAFAH